MKNNNFNFIYRQQKNKFYSLNREKASKINSMNTFLDKEQELK